jgi:sn-glycerol 3-phosphate transport system substrate-binding protein
MFKNFIALLLAVLATSAVAQEIVLRHAMTGAAQDALSTLVLRFNDEQKGKARVVLQELSGVPDKHQLPNLALLDQEDAWAFFGTRPRFKSVTDVLKAGGEKVNPGTFFPQIVDAVDDPRGNLQALPLALTLPVLFYNKEAFTKAGLDPANPPKTWFETQQAAGKLFDAGYKCPLTTSRFAWVHVENIAAQHGEQAMVKTGRGERFALNNLVAVKHLALLASWQKSYYFHYFGSGREGDAKFISGECAMLTGESGLLSELKDARRFTVGIAELPYYEDVYGVHPANVLPDGAAVWVLAGKKKDEEKVAGRFLAYLMRPEVQREWVADTGFLPMMPAALDAMKTAGVSPEIIDAARRRLSMPKQTNVRMHSGFGRNRVREILGEEVEFVWKNTKPAKQALDNAMERANQPSVLNPPRQ